MPVNDLDVAVLSFDTAREVVKLARLFHEAGGQPTKDTYNVQGQGESTALPHRGACVRGVRLCDIMAMRQQFLTSAVLMS
jgi:hypothetical protein